MWVECAKRLPEKDGDYMVVRRAFRGPHKEEWCRYELGPDGGVWKNGRGQKITTVIWWRDDDEILV